MTRSERNSLAAILTAIVLIIGGIVATVLLGVRAPDDVERVAASAVEPAAAAPDPSAAPEVDPLADARVNSIHTGPAPRVRDTFGTGRQAFELFRTWKGEVDVWEGVGPQIILGPEGNWFPAGQPGCGEGRYVVELAGVEKLTASLHDELGDEVTSRALAEGWMLLDDCHLPYVSGEGTVTYRVHEFQPTG